MESRMTFRNRPNFSVKNIFVSILPYLLLIAIAAICYMSIAHLLGYYNDDWYLIYAGVSQGAEKFHDVFAIDRPLRGYFVSWMFDLFGVNPWLYSLGAYLMRCIGGLGLLWILRILWPRERKAIYAAALLFVVYPGFLDQPNAIDFQTHLWGLALAIISIGCTLQAITSPKRLNKAVFIVLSLLSQILYLLLMEYYIGLEGLRLLLIAFISWREDPTHFGKLVWRIFLRYLPYLLTSLGFLFWLTQVFQVQRQTVNVDSMFGYIMENPIKRLVGISLNLLKDVINVIFVAWAEPFYQYAFVEQLKPMLVEIGLALLAGGLAWTGLSLINDKRSDDQGDAHTRLVARDMVLVGLLSTALVLIPISLSNRQVIFNGFSRFSLPPSIGAVFILAGCLVAMRRRILSTWIVVGLVILATMTHIGNGLDYAARWEIVRDFWWQVAWRAPDIAPDTVLMTEYANTGIAEDYFVWGPANLIYYPSVPYQSKTRLPLTAATLANINLNSVLIHSKEKSERRGFVSEMDYSNLLVLSMPDEDFCVHALDGNNLEISSQTRSAISLIAPYSQIKQIKVDEPGSMPPTSIFGEEPAHGWCYFYQKASLARQRGDWNEIIRLGEEAAKLELHPYDVIEWMPFIEANAYLGNDEKARELAGLVKENPFYIPQVCRMFTADTYQLAEQFPDGHPLLVNEFCQPGSE
jgi:hypothetical protein